MPSVPRWLGWTWVAAGFAGLVAAIAVAAFGSMFVTSTTETTLEALVITEQLLHTVGDTAAAVDETLESVAEGLVVVEGSVADGAATLTRVARVADDLGVVVTTTIPDSLDALRDGMPQLIATAGVVDGTMLALRFVGVDYDPNEPLDDALRELDARLASIPGELRAQADNFDQAAAGVSEFGGASLQIAADIGEIRRQMDESRQVVAGYTEVVDEALPVVADLEEQLTAQAATARVIALVLGVALAVGQTVPITFGWWILQRREHPSAR